MEYLLETNNLSKLYGKHKAVKNVNMHVRKGDIYGLIGRNGAGKTSICRELLKKNNEYKNVVKYKSSDENVFVITKEINSHITNFTISLMLCTLIGYLLLCYRKCVL